MNLPNKVTSKIAFLYNLNPFIITVLPNIKAQHPHFAGGVLFCFGGIRTLRGDERKENVPAARF